MGQLAETMREQKRSIKPAIIRGEPVFPRNEMFTSEGFSGFADFLSDEPEEGFAELEKQRQEKMKGFFSIIQALLKLMD